MNAFTRPGAEGSSIRFEQQDGVHDESVPRSAPFGTNPGAAAAGTQRSAGRMRARDRIALVFRVGART